ncbi:MAG TPA: serine protease [Capillimicrobium sp.]|jgi:hypothetical protein
MSRAAARIAALLAIGCPVAAIAAPAHAASPRYIGGTAVASPSDAPFTVLITFGSGSEGGLCTGSIIDTTHVLTAAHCATNSQGQRYPAASIEIGIGFSSLESEEGLFGRVRAVRVHPAYDPASGRADVAVLEVPPIAAGSTIAPIPLVAVGPPVPAGAAVRGFGWGDTGSAASDAWEQMLDLTVGAPTDCWSGVPAVGCARTPAGAACPGDSGGPIVKDGVQVAVTNTRIGLDCAPGSTLGFVDLSAPGIGLFVRGEDNPPAMPFTDTPPSLSAPPLDGGAATCAAPGWTNAAGTTTVFLHRDNGTVVQDGPSTTYTPTRRDVGHELGCRSIAQSPGGMASAAAPSGFAVLDAELEVRPGRTAAAISYSGAPRLALTATLTSKGQPVEWAGEVRAGRRLRLPNVAAGRYRLCVQAPAAGQFAAVEACRRWRARPREAKRG